MNKLFSSAKAFLFDMDGTIVNNCAYHVLAWKEFSKRHNRELTEKEIIDWMGATNRDYQERILGRKVSLEESVRLENEKESLYHELYRPHIKLSDGLREFLNESHALDIRCAIASGAPRQNIDFIFNALNLNDDFECVIDASLYSRSKPDPDCYLTAASRLGVAPKNCIVFEDAVGGILAGKSAGMFVVAITQTSPRDELAKANPDLIIDSFRELLSEE